MGVCKCGCMSLDNIKGIDSQLVEAAICRRKLDRLMGYLVSQILWSGVPGSKSAGRTQSVVLLLLVLKELEIQKHEGVSSYKVTGSFESPDGKYDAHWSSSLKNAKAVQQLFECFKSAKFTIKDKVRTLSKRNPPPPFITSTLQQAGRTLGLSVKQVQSVAQDLYANGHITYIRTDMAEITPSFVKKIREYVIDEYGDEYCAKEGVKKKSKSSAQNSQEGHEAIRVCNLSFYGAGLTGSHKRVYDLIWKRTVASVMSPQELEKYTVKITSDMKTTDYFISEQINELFDGYTRVLKIDKKEGGDKQEQVGEKIIQSLNPGDSASLWGCIGKSVETTPPPRYSDSSLVKELEKKGIGRPSTFESSIQSNLKRGTVIIDSCKGKKIECIDYVMKVSDGNIKEKKRQCEVGAQKKKMFVTDLGFKINTFLQQHFEDIININFTSDLESKLDDITHGSTTALGVLESFYASLKIKLDAVKIAVPSSKMSSSASSSTLLGTLDGVPIYLGKSRYGYYVRKGDVFASVKKNMDVSTLTLEDAKVALEDKQEKKKSTSVVKKFKGNKTTGPITVMKNDRGYYFACKNKFYPLRIKADSEATMKKCIEVLGSMQKKK